MAALARLAVVTAAPKLIEIDALRQHLLDESQDEIATLLSAILATATASRDYPLKAMVRRLKELDKVTRLATNGDPHDQDELEPCDDWSIISVK